MANLSSAYLSHNRGSYCAMIFKLVFKFAEVFQAMLDSFNNVIYLKNVNPSTKLTLRQQIANVYTVETNTPKKSVAEVSFILDHPG